MANIRSHWSLSKVVLPPLESYQTKTKTETEAATADATLRPLDDLRW